MEQSEQEGDSSVPDVEGNVRSPVLTEGEERVIAIITRVSAGKESTEDIEFLIEVATTTSAVLFSQKERIRELEGEAATILVAFRQVWKNINDDGEIMPLKRDTLMRPLFQAFAHRKIGILGAAVISAAKDWAEDPEHDQSLMDAVNALAEGEANGNS